MARSKPGFLASLLASLLALGAGQRLRAVEEATVNAVRVQFLSASLVRIESKGPEGFENRATFHVANREWPGTPFTRTTEANEVVLRTPGCVVRVPENATSLAGIRIETIDGRPVYRCEGRPTNSAWLPGPADSPMAWSFADTPRIVPPRWGLTPAPAGGEHPEASGWDLGNDSPDVYVFLPNGDYRRMRADFLRLTGPTEMPPLYAFGAFDSRWHDYSEASALKQIDDYREHRIPLDVLVVDTGWRQGASTGYQPNPALFPDMNRFLQEAHARNVHVMFNDHPQPLEAHGAALGPEELDYRFNGLSGLLSEGLDIWWFDRNWSSALATPSPGLKKEVWGMRLYHDATQRVRPELRPLIMANVDGIDNGARRRPMDVAAHRFPIQWTGDIGPGYDSLRTAVENAVYSGVHSLFPYMSDDLGGHVADPTPEGYIRWVEYGALSPVYRPHCTMNLERMPWAFGAEAEAVARRFVNLRYRLLPVFYAAAHENYQTGEPILRRLDLDYPQFAEAHWNDEYLIGKGLLVAPVMRGVQDVVPGKWLHTPDGKPGLRADYFSNGELTGQPALTRTDRSLNFPRGAGSPAKEVPNGPFSVRWTGSIDLPGELSGATLMVAGEGVRMWVDDRPVIGTSGLRKSGTASTAPQAAAVDLQAAAGQAHRLRIEYRRVGPHAGIQLAWRAAGDNLPIVRKFWLPPGRWINAWNGETLAGPMVVSNPAPLDQIPMWIRSGTIVPLAPEMQFTGEKPWDPLTLDLYPCVGEMGSTTLYEDDRLTTAYRRGAFRETAINVTADAAGRTVEVVIGASRGDFAGAPARRAWILRMHKPTGWPEGLAPAEAEVNGTKSGLPIERVGQDQGAMPLGDRAGAPDCESFELNLPSAGVSEKIKVAIHWIKRPAG